MLRFLKAVALGLAAAMTLSGCVSTSITGRTLASIDRPIDKLGVYVQTGTFASSNIAASIGNKDVSSLFPHLTRRLPSILALNGIESQAIGSCLGETAVPVEMARFQQVLRIVPQSVSWNSRTGSSLVIGAEVLGRGKGTIWKGSPPLQ